MIQKTKNGGFIINLKFIRYFILILFAIVVFLLNTCSEKISNPSETITNSPILISPTNNSILDTIKYKLRWSSVENASEYQLAMATNSAFENYKNYTVENDTSFVVSDLARRWNYWKVRGKSQDDFGPWSDTSRFHGGDIFYKEFGGSWDEKAGDILLEPSGNLIISGSTYSFGNGANDIWLFGITPKGELIWDKTLGTSENEFEPKIKLSEDGHIIVLYNKRQPSEWVVGDDVIFTIVETDSGNYSRKIAGIPSVFNNSNNPEVKGKYFIKTTDGGYLIIIEHLESNINSLYKISSSGQEEWYETPSLGDDPIINAITETPQGKFIGCGSTYGNGPGGLNYWVFGLNQDGSSSWENILGQNGNDVATDLSEISAGTYSIIGLTNSYTGGNNNQIWYTEYDDEGTKLDESIFNFPVEIYSGIKSKNIETDYIFYSPKFVSRVVPGSPLWTKEISPDAIISDVQVLENNECIVIGTSHPFSIGSEDANIFVMKIDKYGGAPVISR